MELSGGYHSISSPSHISLLLHRTFNVSIPSSHIPRRSSSTPTPTSTYHFEYRPSIRPSPPTKRLLEEQNDDGYEEGEREEEKGYWIDDESGVPISGGDDLKAVEFTVIGYVRSLYLSFDSLHPICSYLSRRLLLFSFLWVSSPLLDIRHWNWISDLVYICVYAATSTPHYFLCACFILYSL